MCQKNSFGLSSVICVTKRYRVFGSGKNVISKLDNFNSDSLLRLCSDSVNMSNLGNNTPVLTSHYNNFALHAIAISLSVADNALLQFLGGQSSIVTVNHPLPYSLSTSTSNAVSTASTTGNPFRTCFG